jgi:FtsH-binding integral membrane protein
MSTQLTLQQLEEIVIPLGIFAVAFLINLAIGYNAEDIRYRIKMLLWFIMGFALTAFVIFVIISTTNLSNHDYGIMMIIVVIVAGFLGLVSFIAILNLVSKGNGEEEEKQRWLTFWSGLLGIALGALTISYMAYENAKT